jgi:predicted nucleic acid-binding protein
VVKAVCLDTRVLSMFLKGKESAKKIIDDYKNKGFEIYTTTINITEYFMGVYKTNILSEEKLKFLRDFFFALHPRTIDYDISVMAGRINATILRGKEIGWRDLYIATITLQNGGILITSNKDHFKRIPDLEIIEYY